MERTPRQWVALMCTCEAISLLNSVRFRADAFGDIMEQFLLDLMQAGYVIYQRDNNGSYVIQKYKKDEDKQECLAHTLDLIIEAAKSKIKWNEVPMEQVWDVELMHKVRMFKTPRFEVLGQTCSPTYEEALVVAKTWGEKVIAPILHSVEHWEVRVRPSKT